MRLRLAQRMVSLVALGTSFVSVAVLPASAQTLVTSIGGLRSALATGDVITVVTEDGTPLSGRLLRFESEELEMRPDERTRGALVRPKPDASYLRNTRQNITLRLDAVRSLERRTDSVRNGAAIGAVVGGGFSGAMFVNALIVDRNEIDEWAGFYAGFAAIS